MATNTTRFIRNIFGDTKPFTMLGLFQAGSTQAIKVGELLEFTGDSNTAFVPIDSDFSMSGHIAIADEEIKAGDRAGYYRIIVPRPGDVFEYDLATAGATTIGTALYYSSSEAVTTTAGTNILGRAIGQDHYPQQQGHLADDASGDAGSTVRSCAYVHMIINPECSYLDRFVQLGANVGDAGGFSGLKWDATNTQVLAYVDGTNVADFGADGAWSDLIT